MGHLASDYSDQAHLWNRQFLLQQSALDDVLLVVRPHPFSLIDPAFKQKHLP